MKKLTTILVFGGKCRNLSFRAAKTLKLLLTKIIIKKAPATEFILEHTKNVFYELIQDNQCYKVFN